MGVEIKQIDLLAFVDSNLGLFSGEQSLNDIIEDFNSECKILYTKVPWVADSKKYFFKMIHLLPCTIEDVDKLEMSSLENVEIILFDIDSVDVSTNKIKQSLTKLTSLLDANKVYFLAQLHQKSQKSPTGSLLNIFFTRAVLPLDPEICYKIKDLSDALRIHFKFLTLKGIYGCNEKYSASGYEHQDLIDRNEQIIEIVDFMLNIAERMKFSYKETEAFTTALVTNLPAKLPSHGEIKNVVQFAAKETIVAEARNAILNFDENAAKTIVQKTIDSEIFPAEIVKIGFIDAMFELTKKFEAGNLPMYLLAEASHVENIGINTLEPREVIPSALKDETLSTLEPIEIIPSLLEETYPTIEDNMSDIFKSIGYKEFDFERDLYSQYLANKVIKTNADIITYNTFINTDFDALKTNIEFFKNVCIRNYSKVRCDKTLSDRLHRWV